MAHQHTTPQSTKPIVRLIVVALAIILLLATFDQSLAQLSDSLASLAKDAVVLLPSFVLTASQALQPGVTDAHHSSLCALQMLLFWPLLNTVAKMA
jgi:hypothetical protein